MHEYRVIQEMFHFKTKAFLDLRTLRRILAFLSIYLSASEVACSNSNLASITFTHLLFTYSVQTRSMDSIGNLLGQDNCQFLNKSLKKLQYPTQQFTPNSHVRRLKLIILFSFDISFSQRVKLSRLIPYPNTLIKLSKAR